MEAQEPPGIRDLLEYEAAIEAAMADRRRFECPPDGAKGESARGVEAPPADRDPHGTLHPTRT
jgi:hypothetical protein